MDRLRDFFASYSSVAVAFSGGVDSSFLLYAAKHFGAKVTGYYVKTAFQPQFELDDALRLSREIGAEMKTIEKDVLSSPIVVKNPSDRCYHCKKEIFSTILTMAYGDGYTVVLDGTNASDDISDRPGYKALQEMKVLSPLKLCGITKSEVRRLSKEAGLFTWDKPAYACLATRIQTGTPITKEDLVRTEEAEDYLFSLGFSDFRVRLRGGAAVVELPEDQMGRFLDKRSEIVARLKKSYSNVYLNMETR